MKGRVMRNASTKNQLKRLSVNDSSAIEWLPVTDLSEVEAWLQDNMEITAQKPPCERLELKDNLELHQARNWVFQSDFLWQGLGCDDALSLLQLLKLTHRDKMSDYVCPNLKNAMRIELAALGFVEYQIGKKSLCKYIDQALTSQAGESLYNKLHEGLLESLPQFLKTERHAMRQWAVAEMRRNYPNGQYPARMTEGDVLDSYFILRKLKLAKRHLFETLSQNITCDWISKIALMPLDRKPTLKLSDNYDRCILGLKPNGQSAMIRELLERESTTLDSYILISLDHFGAIPFGRVPERAGGDSVECGDTALLIKDRVNARLNQLNKNGLRPNLIVDANAIDKEWYKTFFCDQSAVTLKKRTKGKMDILVGCTHNFRETVSRVHEASGVADITSEEIASIYAQALCLNRFINRLPQGYEIQLIDGDVDGVTPFAQINTSAQYEQPFIEKLELLTPQ